MLKKEKYFPDLSSEILITTKKSGHITRVVRKTVRHILEGEQIKENSHEMLIIRELFESKDIKVQNIRDEIEKFIHLASSKANLNGLFDKLSNAPFGLTRQIISLILLDVLLRQGDNVSVFEKGQFQLEINPLLFDRLMVNPQKFEVQKNIFTDERKNYLKALSGVLNKKTNNLLDITKALVDRIKQLDKFTKNTDRLSKSTLKFRNAIINAKEPYKLIFNDIPISLGFKGYETCNNEFFKLLDESIKELDSRYSDLLLEIEDFFFSSFELQPAEKNRKNLVKKVKEVEEFISTDEIKIITNAIKTESLPYERWLEKIATVINSKNVPKNWSDYDLAEFKQKIILIGYEIKRLQIISYMKTCTKGRMVA